MTLVRCVSAVFALIPRVRATPLVLLPSARSWTTSRSRAVSCRCGISRVPTRILAPEVVREHHVGRDRGEERLVLAQRVHRRDQRPPRVGLEHVAPGAGGERFAQHLLRFVHGQDQHFAVWDRLADLACRLEAVQLGHRHVEDRDVGCGHSPPARSLRGRWRPRRRPSTRARSRAARGCRDGPLRDRRR